MDSIINKSCCFTGHRKIDSDEYTMIVEKLELKIIELIENGIIYVTIQSRKWNKAKEMFYEDTWEKLLTAMGMKFTMVYFQKRVKYAKWNNLIWNCW